MADGNAPAPRRSKPVRVSRDAAGREIAAVDAGYSREMDGWRICATCLRVGYDVLPARGDAGPHCFTGLGCEGQAVRAARRGGL